jgi:hypothetical protein
MGFWAACAFSRAWTAAALRAAPILAESVKMGQSFRLQCPIRTRTEDGPVQETVQSGGAKIAKVRYALEHR